MSSTSKKRPVSIPLRRFSLIAATVAAQLAAAQLVLAQDGGGKSPLGTELRGKAPQLSEIIVTARRTAENLQTTPISITALSAADIEQHGFTSVVDVAQAAPSVTIMPGGNYSGDSALTYIRGVGQDQFTYAFDPGVGFYIDDVYFGSVYGSIFDLGDISNIQVLRGPQGTLFGQNNEGGAILLYTPEPKGDDSGTIQFGYGSFRREFVKADFDVPLIPHKLALSVSGGMNEMNGYVTRVDFACAHPAAAGNLQPSTTEAGCIVGSEGGLNDVLLHTALKWWVNDNMTIIVRGELDDDRDEAGAEDTLIQNPPEPGSQAAQYDQYVAIPTYGISAASPLFATSNPYTSYSTYREPNTGFTAPPVDDLLFRYISGTLDWRTPAGVHVKDIVAYQKYESEFVSTDGTPLASEYLEDNKLYYRQFTEELQLSGKLLNDRLEWLAGAYYFSSWGLYGGHIELPNTNIVPPGTPGFPPGGYWGLNFNTDDPTNDWSRSGFLHFVYHATSKLSVELGARYSTDRKSQWFNDTLTATVPSDRLLPPGPEYPPGTGGRASMSHTDPKLALQYQWTPDLMTYAQVGTGYKTGGLNPKPVLITDIKPFLPEHLTAYEVGVKSEWLQHRLMLNADTYLSDYKDIQLSEFLPPPLGDGGTVVVNAARARIEGVELDMRGRLFSGFEMDGGMSFLNYKTLELGAPSADLSGMTLSTRPQYIPRWQGSFGAQYTLHFGAGGDVTARADWSYRSRIYYDLANTSAGAQGGYGILNTRLGWDDAAGKWSAALEISNATDKLYYYAKGTEQNTDGTIFAVGGTPALPRTEFFTVTRKF